MTDQKATTMVLKVDLQCCRCYKKIKKILCKFPQIRDQVYDEKTNTIKIKVVCGSPEKIKQKIICKAGDCLQCIEIEKPKPKEPEKPKEKPKPEKPKEKPKEPEKPKAKPKPEEEKPSKVEIAIDFTIAKRPAFCTCCCDCNHGIPGGPYCRGYGTCRCDCYCGRPVYDSYCGGTYCANENPGACSIM